MKVTVNNLEKEEKIDWNKVQLVISKYDSNCIVLIADHQNPSDYDSFSGINLERGDYSDSWSRANFKPFNGSITLQND
jgi:hypothetical protein